MEKTTIFALNGKKKEEVDTPVVFKTPIRFDLIRRAIKVAQSGQKQPQGRDPLAGKRSSCNSWQTGFGVARVPRVRGSGFPKARNACFVNMTVGGHAAHPPRVEKRLDLKINKKERQIALKTAIAASGKNDLVKKRGHSVDNVKGLPLVIDDKIQTIKKTQKVVEVLKDLGVWEDILRIKRYNKIRPGKGKKRGRKYKRKTGPLIVIKEDFGILNSSKNIPGVEIVDIKKLNVEKLAPGAMAGRLVVWTQSAFNSLVKI